MNKLRIGLGYDVHQLKTGLPFVLGGIEIPSEKGPVAHSDGDVLIHAICDALLGAACMGDIGLHFPDTSNDFRGIDSKILLSRTLEKIREKGYSIQNVDCTVSLEKPKIRAYVDQMRAVLANLMEIETDDVNIKATTAEKMGFVGRQEGIEARAVALLSRA